VYGEGELKGVRLESHRDDGGGLVRGETVMNTDQRYISNELSHFVGRKLIGDIKSQYSVLKNILDTGSIRHDPQTPHTNGQRSMGLTHNLHGSFVTNTMYIPSMVCFCDIPTSDLAIHTAKYGVCGLSFSKEFLNGKGAAPVFYIEKKEAAEFDKIAKSFNILIERIFRCDQDEMPTSVQSLLPNKNAVAQIENFLGFKIFGYIQCFDCGLDDGNPKNYYFEREWRSLYDVEFNLNDVQRVFIPAEMSKQFREDFPGYYGQITFTYSKSA
jgi:hypothetical protein